MRRVIQITACVALMTVPASAAEQAERAAESQANSEVPEILVLAEKAKGVRIKFNIDDRTRKVRCKATRSSGDRRFDEAMCEPVRRCAQVEPFNNETVQACLVRTRQQVLEEWAAAHPSK